MAQLLVTNEPAWYQAIASIRNYSEGDFENKLHKYASDVFQEFYTVKFKYNITFQRDRNQQYKPDLLLIAKNFSKWIFLEVELCKSGLSHTKRQIACFSNPEFDANSVVDFLQRNNPGLFVGKEAELLNLITNKSPGLLVVYDDYCQKIFNELLIDFPDLQICILETYRTPDHELEAYRLSGDYPYEISNISRLSNSTSYHIYKVLKPGIVSSFADGGVDILYKMRKLKGSIIRSRKKVFLKIDENPLPPDICVQLSLDINNQLIIQKV